MANKKITITMPMEVYERLESDRGSIPRSRYIRNLIVGGERLASERGFVGEALSSAGEASGLSEEVENGVEVVKREELPEPKKGYEPVWKGEYFDKIKTRDGKKKKSPGS